MIATDDRVETTSGHENSRDWIKVLMRYREPDLSRSIGELVVTFVPLVGLWLAMWLALGVGYWLVLVLAIPTAAFLVRLFMIQHDCSHDAFFRNRWANAWVGRCISVMTLTPHDFWRRTHALHHANSGLLEGRGIGDIDTLTVSEYRARSAWRRLAYRLYRHPIVLFVIGPAYLFIVQHRIPLGFMRRDGMAPWISTMATNAGIVALFGALIALVGFRDFALVQLPVTLVASSIGVWLFYVQHQFEETRWDRRGDWTHADAALHGSSYYVLPGPLQWLSANIGMHHVHHLCSRIPFYRLPEVLRDHPKLQSIGRLSLGESFSCVGLALWDEEQRRLIGFGDLRPSPAR